MALPGSPQHDFPLLFFLHQQASPPKLVSLSDLPQTALKTSLYLALSIPWSPAKNTLLSTPKLNPYVEKALAPLQLTNDLNAKRTLPWIFFQVSNSHSFFNSTTMIL